MKGYVTALGLSLLLGVAGAASATTAVIDFNTPSRTTASTQLIANGPNGAVTMTSIDGRNAVMTGGTSDNEFLYVTLPKGLFKGSKDVWATVEYYDQGTDKFQLHYDAGTDPSTLDMKDGQDNFAKNDTKMWLTHSWNLAGADFEEAGPGGADIWIDDLADGPEVIDKITLTDQDPNLVHWPHVDPSHPIKIDGVISPGEWDNAYSFTVDTAAQDGGVGANWGGPQDFSGTYSMKWDESGVYVRGDVTDATPRLNDAGSSGPPNYWAGDGFQIYLGLDWSDPAHGAYLDTDYDIYVGLGDTPMWADEWGTPRAVVDWGAIPMANLAITNTTKPVGYQFEFYLPWEMMLKDAKNTTTKVATGQTIGWFFYANNSKEIGPSNQDVAMEPFGLTDQYSHAYEWTAVVLDPFQAPPTAGP